MRITVRARGGEDVIPVRLLWCSCYFKLIVARVAQIWGAYCLWVLRMGLALWHLSSAWNFKAAARLFTNLYTPDLL
jgi:hypothetical protein